MMRVDAGLVCPGCQVALLAAEDGYCCPRCGEAWKRRAEVVVSPRFEEGRYYVELPKPALQFLLERSACTGPARALEERCGYDWSNYLHRYALDLRRALFLEFLDLAPAARVLDIGCGFGPLGLAFAFTAGRVYLVDSTLERCRFAQRRAGELGLENTIGIVTHDWEALPIEKASLDLVIVNGVLEWVPENVPGDPMTVQVRFLERMKEMLRPGGALYLGIENRFALQYWLGYPDDHTSIRFTSLLPRRLASLYSRLRTGKPYRTLTWSYGEYRARLLRLGFQRVDFLCLCPDYRFLERACWMEDKTARRAMLGHFGRKARVAYSFLDRVGLLERLVYSYGIIACA